MSCYSALAPWYDRLTGDVPYGGIADLYEAEFKADGGKFRLLLDLCCGTGSMTWELARRGYEMIAADRSVDMLMQAQGKQGECRVRPLFLCQAAEELDLYGTVDAALCCLDGFNYIAPDVLREVFRRLHLFVRPGGLLIFDIRTPEFLRALDGQIFVDETEDVLCLWRADFDGAQGALVYGMDLSSAAAASGSAAARSTSNTHTSRRSCAGLLNMPASGMSASGATAPRETRADSISLRKGCKHG